ncbi:unnamed protein product [Fraxinus pennsylvanica]|uniref:NAC domain-containing protein n=1 Tax=Fraxinus pennsylvanica TaxID=56036 RepID=A0AAD1Z5N1_9LAMI|nr:unnamed protein product [Fraxinus pennsylvanica]
MRVVSYFSTIRQSTIFKNQLVHPLKNNLRLDDWVLCRLYNKKGTLEKHYNVDQKTLQFSDSEEQKPKLDGFVYNGKVTLVQPALEPQLVKNNYLHSEASESVLKLHTDSSSSEHALSPEFMGDKEVQSVPTWNGFEKPLDYQLNYKDDFQYDPFTSQMQYSDQFSLFDNVFMYTQEPF